jgi:hypothetical protein
LDIAQEQSDVWAFLQARPTSVPRSASMLAS